MKLKFLSISALLICMAAYGGYALGAIQKQKQLDSEFERLNYSVWATDVKVMVGLLDLLQEQRHQETFDKIEGYLDVTLASLGPYARLAKKYPDEDIFKAIKLAKAHRKKYPEHKVHEKLKNGVGMAFGIE